MRLTALFITERVEARHNLIERYAIIYYNLWLSVWMSNIVFLNNIKFWNFCFCNFAKYFNPIYLGGGSKLCTKRFPKWYYSLSYDFWLKNTNFLKLLLNLPLFANKWWGHQIFWSKDSFCIFFKIYNDCLDLVRVSAS